MERFPRLIQWSILLLASLVLGFGLQRFHIPAALLLGPMIVGVAMGLLGLGLIQVPRYDVHHHLLAGRLHEVLGDWRAAPLPLTLLTAPQERLPRRLEVVIDWLTGLLATAIGSA